jgi:hypothetical protein
MKILKIDGKWLFLMLLSAALACHSPKKMVNTEMGTDQEIAFGVQEKSTLILPISISMLQIERKINSIMPWEFHNPEWPNFSQGACKEPHVKFTMQRDSLHFKVDGNTLYFDLDLKYSIEGEACPVCWGEDCTSPKVPFSCGVGKEGWRKMHWKGKIVWSIGNDFQLKTKSESLKLTPANPCEFTWLKIDFTNLVVEQMQSSMKNALTQADLMLSKRNLKKDIEPMLSQLQNGIPIQDKGFLKIEPQRLAIWDMKSQNGRLTATLGIEAILAMSTSPTSTNNQRNISFSHSAFSEKSSQINFHVQYPKSELQNLIAQNVTGKKWPVSDDVSEYLLVHELKLDGTPNNRWRIEMTADIVTKRLKRKNVTVVLEANPNLSSDGKSLVLRDLDLDVSDKNKLLEWGIKWETWKSQLQNEKGLVFSLETALKNAQKAINDQLKNEQWKDIQIQGELNDLRFTRLQWVGDGIRMSVLATGQWRLVWDRPF